MAPWTPVLAGCQVITHYLKLGWFEVLVLGSLRSSGREEGGGGLGGYLGHPATGLCRGQKGETEQVTGAASHPEMFSAGNTHGQGQGYGVDLMMCGWPLDLHSGPGFLVFFLQRRSSLGQVA